MEYDPDSTISKYSNGKTLQSLLNKLQTTSTRSEPLLVPKPVVAVFHALGNANSGDFRRMNRIGIQLDSEFEAVYDTQLFAEELNIRSKRWKIPGNLIKLEDLAARFEMDNLNHLHNAGNDAFATAVSTFGCLVHKAQLITPGISPELVLRSFSNSGYILVFIDIECASERARGCGSASSDVEFGITVVDTADLADATSPGLWMTASKTSHAIIIEHVHKWSRGWPGAARYNAERWSFFRGPNGRRKREVTLPRADGELDATHRLVSSDSEFISLAEISTWLRAKYQVVSERPMYRPELSSTKSVAALPRALADLSEPVASAPDNVTTAPETVVACPETVAGLRDAVAALSKTIAALSDTVAALSETVAALTVVAGSSGR